MQVWHTPVRPDHRAGTSQASASSRQASELRAQATVIPPRAKRRSVRLDTLDFASVHSHRCARHPPRRGGHHEGEQVGNFLRLSVATDSHFFREFFHCLLDAHVMCRRPLPRKQNEWVDGLLFVGNHLALDFLNTNPILEGKPRELLANAAALEGWLLASGVVKTQRDKAFVRAWRDSRAGGALVQRLTAFRERLRATIVRLGKGLLPRKAFLAEVNTLLKEHPQRVHLSKLASHVVLKTCVEPRTPDEVWAPIVAAVANLLSEVEPSRIRKCEAASCVVRFYDTSKKGSRRWCSMNICGNKLKLAAYQRRRRLI